MNKQLDLFNLLDTYGEGIYTQSSMVMDNDAAFLSSSKSVPTIDELFESTNNDKNVVVDLFEEINTTELEEENELLAVADIRSEKQKGKKISYDAGEKIFGARKDLAEIRKQFLENPTSTLLNEIAEMDEFTADELASKSNVFAWFSMEDCHKRGVEVRAAYGISLIIRRIPTNSKGLVRSEYMKAIEFISDCFKSILTFEQFSDTFLRFCNMAIEDFKKEFYEKRANKLQVKANEIIGNDATNINELIDLRYSILETAGCLYLIDNIKPDFYFDKLGTLSELLTSYKKRKSFITSLFKKYSSWDSYFETNGKTAGSQKGVERKPIWERQLPVEPKRIGGREIEELRTPEEFILKFGFRGTQFGHYVEDSMARAHLVNSSRALIDLADILGIDVNDVSLGNELGMAFGARGKGRALGHYEPRENVINLTKEKGSLGILSHEWFHAYDRFLSLKIADNGANLLTEGTQNYLMSSEVFEAYFYLMNAIKEGQSTTFIDVSAAKGTYRLSSSFIALYESLNGDLQAFMNARIETIDKRINSSLEGYVHNPEYYEKMKVKYARRRKKELRESAEALSQLHKEITGEIVTSIPYTINQSNYYRLSIDLDRGKEGKYWSSNVELTARAFEAYISQKLQERGWRSDYLVCGIDPTAYPAGEEQLRISNVMDKFLQVTLPYLRQE
ncbi:hypothetical protein LG296_20795 (plasmid) [Ureibacillus chungkukjangi]|uniref:LPD1 domain-containing protein n=1 Tax=Ureibacillus chungkukjangi TaxID=1202712 RepID=UPI000D391A02|nr:LPD1 domain-containing protein [Ureibacillus chungkukjangi]MCM3389993.1 hypothetical protein [Ureibacillus chungkukjangi]HCG4536216.1 hypothetical protein [Salmonella enterica subsp. enterica serovar Typhi str. AG3]